MSITTNAICLSLVMLVHSCAHSIAPVELKHKAVSSTPQPLALYEAWFGQPKHISVGYASNNPDTIRDQIRKAKELGVNGFVVDWYGDREPYIDRSYAVIQNAAAKEIFNVAIMYEVPDSDQ